MPREQELKGQFLKVLVHLDYVDVVIEEKRKLDYKILLPQQRLIWFGFGIGGVAIFVWELWLPTLKKHLQR